MNDPTDQLGDLYRQHGRSIRAYAASQVNGPHEADEILQEAFLAAAQDVESLRAAKSQKAWLFGIARNISRDRRRKLIRSRGSSLLEEPACREMPDEDPRLDRMRQAIARLPDTHREALELRLACDLSYAETAEALGIPIGTVRSRLHDAVLRIRELVGVANESPTGAQ